jgi:hypothetical protein
MINEPMNEAHSIGKNTKGNLDLKRQKAKENLAKARAIRLEKIKQKKAQIEYDIGDSDQSSVSDSASDESPISEYAPEYVISKRAKKIPAKVPKTSKKKTVQSDVVERTNDSAQLSSDISELKTSMNYLLQQKAKAVKRQTKKRAAKAGNTTKIVMLPSNSTNTVPNNRASCNDLMEALKSTVMRN